jgi:LPXTG-motif cell wall-anchored protein
LFSVSLSTTYTIMGVVAVVGVLTWFLPKKKTKRPAV